MEAQLAQYLLKIKTLLYGVTLHDLRRVIFQFTEGNKKVYPFNKETEMRRGEDTSFLKQHIKLSI